jgi:imidazole glycerol phosphate synthase glutamine amidotransferase subunit
MIAIIDYEAGNLRNVKNILDYLGAESVITSDPKTVMGADRIILPGVGAFGFIMKKLHEKELDAVIKQSIKEGKPFLGICLGFQALFEQSQESPGAKGLGIFKGKVKKFSQGKVPHVGWNNANPVKKFSDIRSGFAYFVHSFYPEPEDKSIILFESDYYGNFCSGVIKGNVVGVQFHPERSGKWGLDFYKKWLEGI